jgi:hypothetical protein
MHSISSYLHHKVIIYTIVVHYYCIISTYLDNLSDFLTKYIVLLFNSSELENLLFVMFYGPSSTQLNHGKYDRSSFVEEKIMDTRSRRGDQDGPHGVA